MEEYGLNSIIEYYFEEAKEKGQLGRVINQQRSYLDIALEGEIRKCSITGKLLHNDDIPVIGDWVVVSNETVVEILPRQNTLSRRSNDKKVTKQVIASHIDLVFLVLPANEVKEGLLNSMINLVTGLNYAIIVNKTDLLSEEELIELKNTLELKYSGFDIIFTNIYDEESIINFRSLIKDYKTYTFLGKSGVGKSSLINKLIGEDLLRVGEINEKSNQGKHTTTHKQLFRFNNSCIIDIPGVRKFVSWITEDDGMLYKEIKELSKLCKFNDCKHNDEPGCNVRENVDESLLYEYHKYLDFQLFLRRNESVEATIEYSKNRKDKYNRSSKKGKR